MQSFRVGLCFINSYEQQHLMDRKQPYLQAISTLCTSQNLASDTFIPILSPTRHRPKPRVFPCRWPWLRTIFYQLHFERNNQELSDAVPPLIFHTVAGNKIPVCLKRCRISLNILSSHFRLTSAMAWCSFHRLIDPSLAYPQNFPGSDRNSNNPVRMKLTRRLLRETIM